MRRLFAVAFVFALLGAVLGFSLRSDPPTALAGGAGNCTVKNGDVNADGAVDLSDAVTILGNLFLGNPAELVPFCAVTPNGLPDTGQVICYTPDGEDWVPAPGCDLPPPGQDGSYATGCPTEGRFTENGDGTVTDNCTGLMWQLEPASFDGGGIPDTMIWCDALLYCQLLSFARHDDWRLPNVRELQSLVDYGRFDPSINPVFGDLPFGRGFWSSTSYAGSALFSWEVNFYTGGVEFGEPSFKDHKNLVRAVRNAP